MDNFNFNFSNMVNAMTDILSSMRPDARQQIVDKMEESICRYIEYGEELKPIGDIIREVEMNMPDGKLFDDEDEYSPFINMGGIEMCLN